MLEVADVSQCLRTGRTRHVARGIELAEFSTLAIAQFADDPGYYLFYCDEEWRVLTDTYHDTREGAVAQAEFEFDDVRFRPIGG